MSLNRSRREGTNTKEKANTSCNSDYVDPIHGTCWGKKRSINSKNNGIMYVRGFRYWRLENKEKKGDYLFSTLYIELLIYIFSKNMRIFFHASDETLKEILITSQKFKILYSF